MKIGKTATNKSEIIIQENVDFTQFNSVADEFCRNWNLKIKKKVNSVDVLMWIVEYEKNLFCISMDHWILEITLMSWGDTPDDKVIELFEITKK